MDITLTVILVCFVVFFIAGFIDAIAGGGGLITMPVLLLLGVPAHYTLGTGKLASSLGSITALITFWKRGAVIKEVVLLGVITSYFGAVIASATTLLISNEKMTNHHDFSSASCDSPFAFLRNSQTDGRRPSEERVVVESLGNRFVRRFL